MEKVVSEPEKKWKKLVCIEYPGVVNNIDKMLVTLGGLDKISEIYGEGTRRLELRFRPDDLHCKPACADLHNTTALAVRVIKRVKKKKGTDQVLDTTYHTKLEGMISSVYKFNNMCDFQYLPVELDIGDDAKTRIHTDLIPNKMTSATWLDESAELHIPPSTFSRMPTPQDYWFRKEGAKESRSEGNVISVTRRRRMHYTVFRSFQDDVCPTQPCSDLRKVVSKKFDAHIVDSVKAEFEKRPIWSKSAIICRLGYSDNQLKIILPSLAYYYNLGPWGKLWVRFGFDPKKDPNAWMYQSFDFRMRQAGGMKYKVEAKRSYSNCTLPYKTGNPCKKKISVIQSDLLGEEADEKKEPDSPDKKTITKDIYLFRPGMIPPYRQMFYQ